VVPIAVRPLVESLLSNNPTKFGQQQLLEYPILRGVLCCNSYRMLDQPPEPTLQGRVMASLKLSFKSRAGGSLV
ncbi:MAG: hypothetical protein VXZ15_00310, partial [Planctomycetota bacterium]|nr:hypothetical protein [Planctomycetota bacterium]